ncbi:MAG: ABC transporter ATP-binding protein [Blautia sp.]|nr:ABC transporter ATP-binding protein [Blautia sp.]
MSGTPVLEIRNLTKAFSMPGGRDFYAVRDVSFSVPQGASLGLVGESGCGKSTIARMITKLTEATGGSILLDGDDITHIPEKEHKKRVFSKVQMVFQDPYGVFSPRMPVGTFLEEGLVFHGVMSRKEASAEAKRLLELVELPSSLLDRMPHQLSGGQQQRVVIARAISIKPRLLILDEATSALDVSVQEGVLKLLMRLQKELQLTYLFIGHDLAVVRSIADRIAVMYAGNLVEEMDSEDLTDTAVHPYTLRLLESVFSIGDKGKKHIELENFSLSDKEDNTGCPFAHRCREAGASCSKEQPGSRLLEKNHVVKCFHVHGAM